MIRMRTYLPEDIDAEAGGVIDAGEITHLRALVAHVGLLARRLRPSPLRAVGGAL